MKSHSVLLTTFACILSVAVSSDYQKCHEEFTLAMNDAPAEVRNKTLLCAQAVESKKKDFELRNGDARKTFESSVADKIKTTQDTMEECSKKVTSEEYFECFQSFKVENRDFLHEIDAKSRNYSIELEAIDREEFDCLSRSIDDKRTKLALSDLRRCLDKGYEPVFKPNSFSTVPPKEDDELNEYVSRLYSTYNTLRSCKKHQEGDSMFDRVFEKCLAESKENKELIEYLRRYPYKLFSKLSESGKPEEYCLKHLAAEFIRPLSYRDDLVYCLDTGFTGFSLYQRNYNGVKRQLNGFYNSLKDCRSNFDLSPRDCIKRVELSMILLVGRLHSIRDEEIEKIVADLKPDDDGNCMRYALKRIQFGGMFIDDSTKEAFEACFHRN